MFDDKCVVAGPLDGVLAHVINDRNAVLPSIRETLRGALGLIGLETERCSGKRV